MNALSTPKELGYRFPADWEPQAAVWFAWPTRDDLWAGVLPRVREQLAALYVLAARFQPVGCALSRIRASRPASSDGAGWRCQRRDTLQLSDRRCVVS